MSFNTIYLDAEKLGAVNLRSEFEMPEGKGAVQATDTGEPIWQAGLDMPGYTAQVNRLDATTMGEMRLRVIGERPTVSAGLVSLSGTLTLTTWANGRGMGMRSATTLTAGSVSQAAPGAQMANYLADLPAIFPSEVFDREHQGNVPTLMRLMGVQEREGLSAYRFGLLISVAPVGPWKVDGSFVLDTNTAPDIVLMGQAIVPVGLRCRWYTPDSPSNYDKSALYLSADRIEAPAVARNVSPKQPKPEATQIDA